jgi:putative aldouronate transport system substrate-binding protein
MTQAEKAFVTTDWIGRMDAFKTQTADTVPDYDLRFANPIGPDQTLPEVSQLCWPRHVSSQSKNIETCFKLLDFTLSPAGKALITMGIEGETYEIDENGMAKYLDPEYAGKTPTMTELQEKYGMYVQGMYLSFDRRCAYFNYTEREQEAQDFGKDPSHISPRDPELVFTEEENTKKNELIATFMKAGREFATKYILNNGGQKEWDNWVAQAEKLGYKELEKIYNDAQARYDAQ